jgi:hypothetical protein
MEAFLVKGFVATEAGTRKGLRLCPPIFSAGSRLLSGTAKAFKKVIIIRI